MEFKITLDDDQLLTQMSGQRKMPIFPESEFKFFAKAVEAQLEFVEENGEITKLILYQNGRSMPWPRTSDTVATRQTLSLSPKQLSHYAGVYPLNVGQDLTISLKDDQLIGQVGNRPPFDLYPETPNLLFSKEVDLTIDTVAEEGANISSVTMHVGPQELTGSRK